MPSAGYFVLFVGNDATFQRFCSCELRAALKTPDSQPRLNGLRTVMRSQKFEWHHIHPSSWWLEN